MYRPDYGFCSFWRNNNLSTSQVSHVVKILPVQNVVDNFKSLSVFVKFLKKILVNFTSLGGVSWVVSFFIKRWTSLFKPWALTTSEVPERQTLFTVWTGFRRWNRVKKSVGSEGVKGQRVPSQKVASGARFRLYVCGTVRHLHDVVVGTLLVGFAS